jgi:hypothetical protein
VKTSRILTIGFATGMLVGALACGSASPSAPSATATVFAQGVPPDGMTFPSGAGITEQGDWLFIRGRASQRYGPVGIAGAVHLTSLEGSGTRFLCVTGNNEVFASLSPCR